MKISRRRFLAGVSAAAAAIEGWYYDSFAPLYVSRGVGTTGIPAHFHCPAELPVFALRAA
jgi:predicted MPP superfamily phosphohydrolase